MTSECSYTGCNAAVTVRRLLKGPGIVYGYCDRHDPLTDTLVNENWEPYTGEVEA